MTVVERTRAICPACHAAQPRPPRFLPARLAEDEGAIWLQRDCPDHGTVTTLYEQDAELWHARRGWSVPPRSTLADRPGLFATQLPVYAQGLPEDHGQHTCTLVLNVTGRCQLTCPTCFATAGPATTGIDVPLPDILRTVRQVTAREGGQLDVAMLSGGEPTLRPDLAELVDRLAELPITRLLLNTNGLRLATDDRLLARLAAHRAHLEIYLQFDGFGPEAHRGLRAEDLTATKQAVVERLDAAGLAMTLVTTAALGVNDHQLGDILRYGLGVPHVAGWAVQPVFGSGRGDLVEPTARLTPTGVVRRLADQAPELLSVDDFIPLPCSHPDCCDLAYFVRDAEDAWRSVIRLIGRVQLRRWLPLIGNTITFEELSAPGLTALRTGDAPAEHALRRVLGELPALAGLLRGLCCRGRREPTVLATVAQRAFRLTIKQFQDASTVREERLRQCCTHTATFEADTRRHSFCWHWLFGDAPL